MGTRLFLLTALILAVSSISAYTYQNVSWTPLNETSTTSFKDLVNRFSTARDYGSEGYTEAQRFIEEWFNDLNMTFIKQTFATFNDNITGANLIGVLPGDMSANATHRFYLVGAHYDTMKNNPGVTDNGSGMSAVLEIARLLNLLAYYNCSMEYSILFVGFDMSQPVPDFGDEPPCPLAAGIGPCGVFAFVDWLKDYLKQQNDAELVGTFILDSILNYNTSLNSQVLSDDARILLPDYYAKVSSSGYKGNYIAGVVRAEDLILAQNFQESWETRPLNELYQFRQVDLVGEADPSPNVHIQLPTLFQSEHMQLWAENYTTMLITDTLDQRGFQQVCFDQACDTLENISEDNYEFGYQTARAVADSIFKLGNGNCFTNVTAPTDAAGSLFPSLFTFVLIHFVGFVLLLL